ncbi:hypothetical protein Tco_0271213 [Tanacetum coccineum]
MQLLGGGENSEMQVVVLQKPPSYTEGEPHPMATEVKETLQEPQDTKPIPITIVRPTTKPSLEVEIIRSSSRPQLTDPVLEVQVP